MKYKHIWILTGLLFFVVTTQAQKPTKVFTSSLFKGMDAYSQSDKDENFNKAKASFEKILLKDSTIALANMGLGIVYSYDKYTGKDYFKGWSYFKKAYDAQDTFSDDDIIVLNELFFKQNKARRNRPINKNMDWESKQIEDKLIKFVREENKLEHANRFLVEFPNSKYYTNVMHIRNYIEFRTAENTNTEQAYNQFIEKYPDAAQVEIAVKDRNELAYQAALAQNSLNALRKFVQKYPEAEQIEEAKKLMGLLAFKEAKAKRNLEVIEQFMREYPNSSKMPEAKALKQQLLFEWAKSVNTLDAYNQFVALYPEGNQYIDIFNLKANVLGQEVLMDFPMENYLFVKGFDNQQFDDFGGGMAQYANGEFVIGATSRKDAESRYDSWLLGLDASGKMLWNKFLGNPYDDYVHLLKVSPNKDVYVSGITNAIEDSLPGQPWFYKLNANGENVYNRKMEGDAILDFEIYNDGKALIAGYVYNTEDSTDIPSLVKVNESGKKLWSRQYASKGRIHSLSMLADNLAAVATHNWVFCLNESGYLKWDVFAEEGEHFETMGSDNEKLLLVGNKTESGLAVAYSTSGERLWAVDFNQPDSGRMEKVLPMTDGGFLVAGTFYDDGIKLIKIGATGALGQEKTFNLPTGITLNDLVLTADGSVVVSATRKDDKSDLIVFKVGF